jgi:prephenate dehydrogenase
MKRLAIVGLGLMGGSLGLAARRRGVAESVWGYSRRASSREGALRIGAVDRAFETPEEAVAGADVAVFCVPILAIPALVRRCLAAFPARCVVTDVGSTKAGLAAEMGPLFARGRPAFVGSHPIAGSEAVGIEAAREDLYDGAVVAVTPKRGKTRGAERRAVRIVRALWEGVGGRVLLLGPGEHDRIVARTSHLPHLVASMLVATVGRGGWTRAAPLCGPGFRDSTRIAAGSEDMWRDIVESNRQALEVELAAFGQSLDRVRRMLAASDFAAMRRFLARSGRARRGLRGGGTV